MVSLPSNPFTEERQEELKESAEEFLTTFSKEYLKALGLCLLQKAIKDAQPREDDGTRLKYRKWTAVERPELFSGYVYFKSGDGPGAWKKWQKVFLAETQDYNIEVYKTEQDFQKKKKAKTSVRPCGYKLIRHVSDHYKQTLEEIGPHMGMSDDEIEEFTTLSDYAWAYTHPLRKNFLFQLHKSKEPKGCLCLGGGAVEDDDGAGSEEAKDRPKYIRALDTCIAKSSVRDKSSIKGKAFDKACKKMFEDLENLNGFSDDGTEAEMLTDMIVRQCLMPLQQPMLEELADAPPKFKLTIWMKARGLVLTGMENVVKPGWAGMEKAADELIDKVEPKLKSGIQKIIDAKEEVKEKVREAIINDVSDALAKYVSPYLRRLFEAFERPVTKAFNFQRRILEKKVPSLEKLPREEATRNRELDKIPRTRQVTRDMESAAEDIVDLLEKVKELDEEVFDYVDVEDYQKKALDAILRVFDAAIYTIELDTAARGLNPAIKFDVLRQWEHDSHIVKIQFIKEAMRAILLDGVKKLLAPVVDPILDPIDDEIPEDLQEMLSARGLYDELLDLLVGEPIDAMVDAQYAPPE